MTGINVLDPGFQTTIQDLGRYGFAQYGVSASGAADPISLRIGNLLVGNEKNAAALEMTLLGVEVEFESAAIIALTGSDFKPKLEAESVPLWTSFRVRPGQKLRLTATTGGARSYLCVHGGFNVPQVLGSVSTHTITGVGGLGRPLKKGDHIDIHPGSLDTVRLTRFNPTYIDEISVRGTLRVTEGVQIDWFKDESHEKFCSSPFRVSEESNRMGLRLSGPILERQNDGDLVTEGVTLGAVQVSHDGQPIILFVEHQTTGGYPKIANVISADLHRVGQLRPRDVVRFRFTTMAEAYAFNKRIESLISPASLLKA